MGRLDAGSGWLGGVFAAIKHIVMSIPKSCDLWSQ